MTKPAFSGDIFGDRRRALEDSFFMEVDRKLLEQMRLKLEAFEEENKLAHVSGIVEQRILTNLVKAGVRAETLMAIRLIPMAEVAWCDGSVAPPERNAVLNAAIAQGIHADSPSYELLEHWLQNRPDVQVIAAWKEYVKEVAHLMPPESLASMRKQMIERCQQVADAAGGFLGLSTISKTEQAKIDEFALAWEE